MEINRVSSQGIATVQSAGVREGRSEQSQQSLEANSRDSEQQSQQPQKVSKDLLEKTVRGLNEFLLPSTTSLRFQLHDKLEEYYVQVVDDRTKEVIREIPSKDLLDMYASMRDVLGLVVDQKV